MAIQFKGLSQGTTQTVPYTSTGGNLLVLCLRSATSSTIITDANNTWVNVFNHQSGAGDYVKCWYAASCFGGANSITLASGSSYQWMLLEYAGVLYVNPEDQQNFSYTAPFVSSVQPGSITPQFNGELVVCMSANSTVNSTTQTIDSGMTVRGNVTGNLYVADIVQTTAAQINPTWTESSGTIGQWFTGILSFQSAPSVPSNSWSRQGVVVPPNFTDYNAPHSITSGTQMGSVIYDTNPQILTGNANVFKIWFVGENHLYYAESLDGINWTRHSGTVLSAICGYPNVFKNGSTYYLSSAPGVGGGAQIDIYSSTDGITWTIYKSAAIIQNVTGWEAAAGAVMAHGFIWIESGTWYMMYDIFVNSPPQDSVGLATSPDGLTWTKSPSNPVISGDPQVGGPHVHKVGSTYYMWAQSWDGSVSDIYRYHSTNLTSWTLDIGGDDSRSVFHRLEPDEGPIGIADSGQVADKCILTVGNTTYLWYTASGADAASGGVGFAIKLATTPRTLDQVVASSEGSVAQTIINPSTDVNVAYVQSTQYASAGAEGPTITKAYTSNNTAGNFLVLVGRLTKGTTTLPGVSSLIDSQGNTWKFAHTFRNNGVDIGVCYYAENCAGGANTVSLTVDNSATFFYFIIAEYSGVKTNGSLTQTTTACGPTTTGHPSVGAAAKSGNLHTLATNQLLISHVSNQNGTSLTLTPATGWTNRQTVNGDLGLFDGVATTLGTYQASVGLSAPVNWGEGISSFLTIDSVFPTPTLAYSVPDCRNYGNFPNVSRSVNGTLIYDVQTSDNASVPGKDSRTAGAPVACGTYPQNSRTPGTFGPGE